jgi:RNA polymerase primary sigma factor
MDEDELGPSQSATTRTSSEQLSGGKQSDLTERESRILRMRFSLGADADLTLEDVERRFAVTRERIRQIKGKLFGIRTPPEEDR